MKNWRNSRYDECKKGKTDDVGTRLIFHVKRGDMA